MNITEVKIIKTNITSSISLSLNQKYLASLSRQQDRLSSKFIYSLSVYTFPTLQLLAQYQVYKTYSEDKHFIKFSIDSQQIFVVTRYQVQIYKLSGNKIQKNSVILHNQKQIYDFDRSLDGKYILLVGDQVLLWDLSDLEKIEFSKNVSSIRFARFSYDNRYLYLSSPTQISKFSYSGLTNFTKLTQKETPPQAGQVTSISVNPVNSQQIAIGYINDNPNIFNSEINLFFPPAQGIQPDRLQNPKQVAYMPDGVRIVSSDYKNGVGIWPGIQNKLFYLENNLNYGLIPSQRGTRIVGYVWKTIKLAEIVVKCSDGQFLAQCACPSDRIWDYATYSCRIIDCSSIAHSTGQLSNNVCLCQNSYYFDRASKKCKINCSSIPNAITNLGDNCSCKNLYQWNSQQKMCLFSCSNIKYSTGIMIQSNDKCQCKETFRWNDQLKVCQCPLNMKIIPSGTAKNLIEKCQCIDNYFFDLQTNQCIIPSCSVFQNVNITSTGVQRHKNSCNCKNGYEFVRIKDQAGCRLNCSAITNAKIDKISFDQCLCQQHTLWNGTHCLPDCSLITFAKTNSSSPQVCQCAVNYNWVPVNNQCARSCAGVANVNFSQTASLKKCPCNKQFKWNQIYEKCAILCDNKNHTTKFESTNPETCDCEYQYIWNPETLNCAINCGTIWQATNRISDQLCQCSGSKFFDAKEKICKENIQDSSIFSNLWFIFLIVVAGIATYIVIVVLIRFCWTFRQSNDQQTITAKKVQSRKRRKSTKNTQDPPMTKRFLKTVQPMPTVETEDIEK